MFHARSIRSTNARGEPRPRAGATEERSLLGVGSTAMFNAIIQKAVGDFAASQQNETSETPTPRHPNEDHEPGSGRPSSFATCVMSSVLPLPNRIEDMMNSRSSNPCPPVPPTET